MTRAARRFFSFFAGFLFLALLLVVFAPRMCGANSNSLTMQAEDEKAVTWTLNADKVTSLSVSEVIEASGNVVLQRGSEYLKADYARYYSTTKWVFLRGNVAARMGRDEMRADEAEFDLRSRVGWLKQGRIFMDGPHMYFSGERVDKHWGDVYSFKNAKITACDGKVPAWSLVADEAVVELDGYAQLSRPRFQVKDQPVLASPWMLLPAKKERQSGFLTPEFGRSNQRGFYYNQPFFWAVDESQDVTFNEYFMDKRGFMQGVEYRTRPSVRETGWLRFDWIKDKIEVNNDGDDDVNSHDGFVRNNTNRYWVRGMYEGHLGDPKWKLRGDLDYVSDQNFLHEFRSGHSGYARSRDELFSLFRRDIQEKDLMRQSGLMLFRDWDRVSVALSGSYMQDQNLGHGNRRKSTDTTVQTLPAVNLFLNKGSIFDGVPLEMAGMAEAGYKYRRNGTRGMRYVMTPTLSLPVNGRYGSFMATAGLQQSFYGTDTYSKTETDDPKQDGKSQTIPTFQLDGSTELDRVYRLAPSIKASEDTVGKTRWTAVRHVVQPRVRYRNIPLKDQHDNPRYDDGDRIRPVNEMTYSVTNVLTRKRERVVAAKAVNEQEQTTPELRSDYLDLVRLTLEQSYDIREADRDDDRAAYERRPFSDVMGELAIGFDEYVSFVSRSHWSPYLDEFTRHDHGLSFTAPGRGRLYTGFGYRRRIHEYIRKRDDEVKTLTMNGSLNLWGPWAINFKYSHDYERSENVDRTLEVVYNHQCFQIMGVFSKDAYEENYGVRVALTGLGS